jgi:dTDP-4-amino-4,6-dideoxygalactose transaminase
LVCKNEEDKQKTIFLATQARDEAPHYQHSEIGYNYRMSTVLAGIGLGQMEVLSQHISLRRINNEFYQQLFKGVNGITVFKEPSQDYFSNHWLSCIVIDSEVTGFTREDLRLQLEKDNIESRPLWKAMHLQPVFNDCAYYGGNIAETLFKNGLCLPSGSNLTDADRERIENSINKLMQFNN